MTHQELTRTTPWVNPGTGKQPGWLGAWLWLLPGRETLCSTSESDWISQIGQRSLASETALVPLRVPLAILASASGDCQFLALTAGR